MPDLTFKFLKTYFELPLIQAVEDKLLLNVTLPQ